MGDSNKQLLKTVEEKLDEFFANGPWRDGVKEEEVQNLIDFANDLYDPFEAQTISPIPEGSFGCFGADDWPGVGIRVVKCTRCKPDPGKGKCEGCPCAVEGGGRCSQLCSCELVCCPEEKRHALEEADIVLSDSSGEESGSDGSESDGEDDLPGVLPGCEPMDIEGFEQEHVFEYEQLLEAEQDGQARSTQGFMSNAGSHECRI
eukprot:g8312.t1